MRKINGREGSDFSKREMKEYLEREGSEQASLLRKGERGNQEAYLVFLKFHANINICNFVLEINILF